MIIAIPKRKSGDPASRVVTAIISSKRLDAKRLLIKKGLNWEEWDFVQIDLPIRKREY